MNVVRNNSLFGNAYAFEHGLLPKAASSFYCSNCIHNAKRQDAFDGSRYNAQYQGLGIIFIPRLYVERECR